MPIEGKEFKIGDHAYIICPFTAEIGLELLFDLTQYTSLIGEAIEGIKFDDSITMSEMLSDDQLAVDLITRILKASPKFLTRETIPFIKRLISQTMVDGKALRDSAVFNAIFSANYSDLFILVGKVLQVNFGNDVKDIKDFFTNLLGRTKLNLKKIN